MSPFQQILFYALICEGMIAFGLAIFVVWEDRKTK